MHAIRVLSKFDNAQAIQMRPLGHHLFSVLNSAYKENRYLQRKYVNEGLRVRLI